METSSLEFIQLEKAAREQELGGIPPLVSSAKPSH